MGILERQSTKTANHRSNLLRKIRPASRQRRLNPKGRRRIGRILLKKRIMKSWQSFK